MGAPLRHAALLLCALRSLHLGCAENITHFSVNAFLCAFTSGDALVAALPAEGVVIDGIIAGASAHARVALQDVDANADNTRATLLIGGPGNASQTPFLGMDGGNFRGSLVSFQLLPGQQLNWSAAAGFFTVVPDSAAAVPLSAAQFSCSCADTRCVAPSAAANASGVTCTQVGNFERVEVGDTDDAGPPSEQQMRHVSRFCVQSSACSEERGPCPASDTPGPNAERPPAPSRPPRPPPPPPRPPRPPAARTPPPSDPPASTPPTPEQPPGGTQPQSQPAFPGFPHPALSQQPPPPVAASPAPPSPSSSGDASSNRVRVIGIAVASCCAVLGTALCVGAVTLRTLRSRYSRMSAAAPLLDAHTVVEPRHTPPAVTKPAAAVAEDEESAHAVTRGVELTRLWTASCSDAAAEHAGDADV